MILDFHPKIGARSPFYDKTSLLSSLLNGKATEIESFLQSINFIPQKSHLKVCVSFCTDCICLINWTPGLYGLSQTDT